MQCVHEDVLHCYRPLPLPYLYIASASVPLSETYSGQENNWLQS